MMVHLFDTILRYFPFLAVGVNLFNLWRVRATLPRTGWLFQGIMIGFFLFWGLLQIVGGYPSFLFVFSEPFTQPLVVFFWVVYLLFLWGTTVWVLWGGGAEVLTIGSGGRNPGVMKVFFGIASIAFPIVVWMLHTSGAFANVP